MDTLLNSRQKIKNNLHEETIIGNPIQFYSGSDAYIGNVLILYIKPRKVSYNSNGKEEQTFLSAYSEPIMAGTSPNLYSFGNMSQNAKINNYPLQLPVGTYIFQAYSDSGNNDLKIILNLLDGSEQEVPLSLINSNCYRGAFTITQSTTGISWPVEQNTLYRIQIREGTLMPEDSPFPYIPYQNKKPFKKPSTKGTLLLSNEYPHAYIPELKTNWGNWKNDAYCHHFAVPFDWTNEVGTVWSGIYVFTPNQTYLQSGMQMVTCGKSLSPMINLRDSTGGYINTENGLYFECGANTSLLDKYISIDANSSEQALSKADSDVLRNGCVNNITDPGYFRMKSSTEYYDQNNSPIRGIELCLPQYCGSTLEEKRAYLADNPIQILYPLKLFRIYTFPAILSEINRNIVQGVNRLDVLTQKFSNQDDMPSLLKSGRISTNSSFSIKADFAAPHISYAKQWLRPEVIIV